jgi:hypothetical protein
LRWCNTCNNDSGNDPRMQYYCSVLCSSICLVSTNGFGGMTNVLHWLWMLSCGQSDTIFLLLSCAEKVHLLMYLSHMLCKFGAPNVIAVDLALDQFLLICCLDLISLGPHIRFSHFWLVKFWFEILSGPDQNMFLHPCIA